MADLNPRGDDRGQLILVGAVVLAVTFIGLAIVVNSAIFSENLATRGDVPGSGEALDYRYEVEQGVGEIVETVNANESKDLSQIENSIESSVENISSQAGFQQARSGRVLSLSYNGRERGKRIVQNDSGPLSENSTKILASSVTKTRNVHLNFTDNISSATITGDFELIVQDSSGTSFWNMTVDASGDNSLTVEVNDTGVVTGPETCEFESDTPSIDITGASIDGERCQALVRNGTGEPLWFAAGISGYEIRFETGDQYNGTYSMIVDDGASPSDPSENVVYSVTVGFDYATSDVRYETEIEVAPGEVPP